MKSAKKNYLSRMLYLAIVMMLSAVFIVGTPTVFVRASEKINNPVMDKKEVTTWDCIYFGNYPQSSDGQGGFAIEPIKWRVLSINGNDAFLMSDQILDSMPFNEKRKGVADDYIDYCLWERSTIRSWLNGYEASSNKNGIDYTENNFINKAFNKEEQDAIITTTVVNDKEVEYPHTEDDRNRKNTMDKVYLADINEVTSLVYGFTEDDEETFTRTVTNTAYAAAGGSSKSTGMKGVGEKNSWILRSPGEYSCYCDFINFNGAYDDLLVDGNSNSSTDHGVRPVIHLDLSNTNLWKYAGQVKSLKDQKITVNASYIKTYGDPTFSLNAKTNGDGTLSYRSNNEDVVKVDKNGKVSIVGAGSATVFVTASETGEYSQVTRTVGITVRKAVPTLNVVNYTKTYGEKAFNLNVKADDKLKYHSNNVKVATVDENGKVTIKGVGTATVTIEESKNYQTAIVTITVKKASQSITAKNVSKVYGAKAFNLGAKASSKLTYKSSNTKVVTVDKNGKVTVKGPGVSKITVSASETANYLKASKTITVKVAPKKATITKVTSSKAKTLVVTWKKDSTVTGYQIQYATNKKFTSAKTVTVSKASTVKKTISKLKSKKTYYIRIRSYKKANSTTIYGAYSATKKIKIK